MLFFPTLPSTLQAIIANRKIIGGAGVAIAVGCIFEPLRTAASGVIGAVQGMIGAAVLTAFGFSSCSITTAAIIGALSGAAIAAPFAIAMGLWGILNGVLQGRGMAYSLANTALDAGIMFLASFIISNSLALGILPTAAVTLGAAIFDGVLEGISLVF